MPYTNNSELPDSIKNALPAEAQTIWRKAYNSADKDEEGSAKIAWSAVKKAGYEKQDDKWVKMDRESFFSKLYEIDMEIFSTGTWHGDKYTESDLDNMVANFYALKDEIKPPLKLGHNKSQVKDLMRDGQPALGWIAGLKKQGNKLIATLKNVPEVAYKAIKQGLYKRLSAEMYWNYKALSGNIHSRVLSAVAMLGADIPEVRNLADLEAYMSQSTDKGSFEKLIVYDFDINKQTQPDHDEDKKMEKEFKEQLEAEKSKAQAASEKAEKLEMELKEFKDNQRKELRKNRVNEVRTFCEAQVKDGKMTPAFRDAFLENLEKEPYSDDKGFSVSFATFENLFTEYNAILEKKEFSQDGNGDNKSDQVDLSDFQAVGNEVDRLAREFSQKNKVDYDKAVDEILTDPKHEKLAEAYTKY